MTKNNENLDRTNEGSLPEDDRDDAMRLIIDTPDDNSFEKDVSFVESSSFDADDNVSTDTKEPFFVADDDDSDDIRNPEKEDFVELDTPAFDDIISGSNEEVMVSASDYSDPVEKAKRIRIAKLVAGAIGVVALLVLFVFGIKLLLDDSGYSETNNSGPVVNATTGTKNESPYPPGVDPKTGENTVNPEAEKPLLKLIKNPVEVRPHEVSLTGVKDGFVTSSDVLIKFKKAKIAKSDSVCSVKESSDFCLAGYVKLKENYATVYFLKDAGRSRFFENPENFTPVEVEGATAAATIKVSVGSKNKEQVLAVVLDDMSGVMVTFDNNGSIDDFVEAVTVS